MASAGPQTVETSDLAELDTLVDAVKVESPVEETDSGNSSGTEVKEASSDGEVVTIEGGEPDVSSEAAVAEPEAEAPPVAEGGVTVPKARPLEDATAKALSAVQDWWVTVEPFLRQQLKQLMATLAPLVEQSAMGLKRLQTELEPHLQPAAAVVAQWKNQLEPHMTVVLTHVQTASEAVRTKAYEPAYAAVVAASEAVQVHAAATAALVQKQAAATAEWYDANMKERVQEAQKAAIEHAAMALQALEAWRKELEPLAREQLLKTVEGAKLLAEQSKLAAIKLAEEGGKAAVKMSEEGGKAAVKLQEEGGKAMVLLTEEGGKALQMAGEKLAPMLEATKQEAAKASVQFKALVEMWGDQVVGQMSVWGKELEAPMAAFQAWLLQTMHCLCTPFAQPIKYKEMGEADYPKPVETHAEAA